MVTVMYVLFFNSIIISVIAMAYMYIGKVILKKYFAGFYYYSWLVFLVGSLIPFRFNSGMFIKNNTENGENLRMMQAAASDAGNDVLTKTQTAAESGSIINSDFILGAALIVWFAGFSIFFITAFRKHYKMAGTIKRWEITEKDGHVLALYKRAIHELKINKAPILMRCPCIDTPMMTGFIRPQVVLPDKKFSDDELYMYLSHELVHYKRHDVWYKLLVIVVQSLYWFNPLIHMMAWNISRQCENSCDERVLKGMGDEDRKVYGMLILNTAIYSRTNLSLLMTGFIPTKKFKENKSDLKERLEIVMDTGKKKKGIIPLLLCIAVVGIAGITIPVNADKHSEGKSVNVDAAKDNAGKNSTDNSSGGSIADKQSSNVNEVKNSNGNTDKQNINTNEVKNSNNNTDKTKKADKTKKSKIVLNNVDAIAADSSSDIEFEYNDGKPVAIYYSSDSSDIKNDNHDKKSASKKKRSGSTDNKNKKYNSSDKKQADKDKKSDSQNNTHADVEVGNSVSMN